MNNTNHRMRGFGAAPILGGNGNGAASKHETGDAPRRFRSLLSSAVLAQLKNKDEALKYIISIVVPAFIILKAALVARLRVLQPAIEFCQRELARIEGKKSNLPPTLPETEPKPHWPDSWPLRGMACILLALIGGLAILGLVNCAQFAVLTTNNWWTACLFAAPMLAVPFTLKYVLEVLPERSKPAVYAGLGLLGAAGVGAFVYTFATRFGLTASLGDASTVQSLLSSKEDNRLQLAAQMLTELSCGTALVLWFRKLMLGSVRHIVNPLLNELEQARSLLQEELAKLEKEAGEVQGNLDALPHREEAAIAEGVAVFYFEQEKATRQTRLQEELEHAVAA
jgi:hypothetical protein